MDKLLKELICKIEAQDLITWQVVERVCLDASKIRICYICGTTKSPMWICDIETNICRCAYCQIERKLNNEKL